MRKVDEFLLKATDVGHRFSHKADWLFRGLDIAIHPGEIVSVLGPNARGKTTLLTCLAGIRSPREGHIEVTGSLGFVPQSHASDYPFTAMNMVLMGRASKVRAWSVPNADDEAAAWEALERVGMAEQGAQQFGDLSGGQRQLVLMARALVCEPSVLILDEPTSALDLRNQRQVLLVLRALAETGMGIMFTTHDPTHALHVSTHTLRMDADVEFGATHELLTDVSLSKMYRVPVHTTPVGFESGTRPVVAPDLLAEEL